MSICLNHFNSLGKFEFCSPNLCSVLSTSVALWVWSSEDGTFRCSSPSVHRIKLPTQNLGGNIKIEVKKGRFSCVEIREPRNRTSK